MNLFGYSMNLLDWMNRIYRVKHFGLTTLKSAFERLSYGGCAIFHIREFSIARSRTAITSFINFLAWARQRSSLFKENSGLQGFWYPCVRQGTPMAGMWRLMSVVSLVARKVIPRQKRQTEPPPNALYWLSTLNSIQNS